MALSTEKKKWSAVHSIIYNVNQKIVEQLLEINHEIIPTTDFQTTFEQCVFYL